MTRKKFARGFVCQTCDKKFKETTLDEFNIENPLPKEVLKRVFQQKGLKKEKYVRLN